MATTSRSQFAAPSAQGKHLLKAKGPRFGMVTMATYKAAQYALAADAGDVPTGAAFDAVIPRHGATEAQRFFDTTARASYGGSGKPTRFEQLAARSAKGSGAGGPGAPRPERGIRASATVGEVWRDSADPKDSTAAQRCWLPGGDPGLTALRNPAKPVAASGNHASLQVTGSGTGVVKAAPGTRAGSQTAAWQAPSRRTLITGDAAQRSRRPGRRVFADE